MQQKQPLVLNSDETKDTSPVTLRPSWVPDRGPVGGAPKSNKATTENRTTAAPIAVVEPVELTTVNIAADTTTVVVDAEPEPFTPSGVMVEVKADLPIQGVSNFDGDDTPPPPVEAPKVTKATKTAAPAPAPE